MKDRKSKNMGNLIKMNKQWKVLRVDIAYSLIQLYCFLRQEKLIPWDV